jgi:peptide/nickel transport system permease protein
LWEVRLSDGRRLLAERVTRLDAALVLERPTGALRVAADTVVEVTPRRHILGTDQLGRDVLSRILHGTRVTLAVAVMAAGLALALGVAVGALAALGGPLVDELVMRAVDGLLAFPGLLLVLFVATVFEPSTATLVAIIGGTGWMGLSRIVRAELLVLERQPWVEATRSIGVGPVALLWRHLLPNAAAPILVAGSLGVADAILMESAVSYLGLGVGSDLPSWGRIAADGAGELAQQWWISTFPGFAIVLTVLAFNLIADGYRDLAPSGSMRGGWRRRDQTPA